MLKFTKIISVFIFALLALCQTTASARTLKVIEAFASAPEMPSDPASSISAEFIAASSELKRGQPVEVEIRFSNVPDGSSASIQWYQDDAALLDGYYSNILLTEGKTLKYSSILPRYGSAGEVTVISVYYAVGGVMHSKSVTIPFADGYHLNEEAQRVLSIVQPVRIDAAVTKDTATYSDRYLTGKTGSVSKGTQVYYFDHRDEDAAYIQLYDGSFVWVPYDAVSVSSKSYTVSGDFTQAEKETFINAVGYHSETAYLIWINPQRQRVNIFMGSQYNWELIKSFTCSTGANITPTPIGIYTYCARQDKWVKPDYQVRPILYFDMYRGLAFHSRLYSVDGSHIIDATIGRPASQGCIRMLDDDVRWMELYMTFGTTVVVY